MVKLSIIIPYYKTYELTRKLLNSLRFQMNDNVEVIVIDDGCNEMELEEEFWNFKNITITHNENNMGVSYSRNFGIDLAMGDYIAFIDSDDMVMSNYIETLLDLINTRNEDIIYFNWLDINTNQVNIHPQNCAVWKAIYKKNILPRFDEKLKRAEDYYFQEELKKIEHSKYYYDKVLYIYNSGRENSLTWKNERGIL